MEQKQEKDKENVQLPIEPFLRLTSKPIKDDNSLGLLYFSCDKMQCNRECVTFSLANPCLTIHLSMS